MYYLWCKTMKTFLLILLLCFISTPAFAVEVLTSYKEETLPVLNEELRLINENNSATQTSLDTLEATVAAINSVPAGVIVMWSGTIVTIPTGWVLCDGNNGTPNLTDKFIVGAKQDDSGTAKTNITGSLTQTGGTATHTHPSNTSTVLDANSADYTAHNVYVVDSTSGLDGSAMYTVIDTGTGRNYYPVRTGVSAVGTLPTYFSLAYIMKQ